MGSRGRAILRAFSDLWEMIITQMPGPTGYSLRRRFWRRRLRSMGRGVRIDVGVYMQNPEHISLGDNCWIDRNVIILAGVPDGDRLTYAKINSDYQLEPGMVQIGENTHIAPNCVLSGLAGLSIGRNCGVAANSCVYSFSQHYRNLQDRSDLRQFSYTPMARSDQQALIASPVVLEDYCAIGASSVVLPGVTLKRGSWVASNMVVSTSYESQTLIYSDLVPKTKDLSGHSIHE